MAFPADTNHAATVLGGFAALRTRLDRVEADAGADRETWFGDVPRDPSVSPFSWEERDKAGTLFFARVAPILAELRKSTGPYTAGVFDRLVRETAARKRANLREAAAFPGQASAPLYGDKAEALAGETTGQLALLLAAHATVGREWKRREEWWTTESPDLEAFRRGLSQALRAVRPEPPVTLFPAAAKDLPRPDDIRKAPVPAVAEVPRNREFWKLLQKRFVQCCRNALLLKWENTLLDKVVEAAELEAAAVKELVDQACELPGGETAVVTAACDELLLQVEAFALEAKETMKGSLQA